MKILGISGSLRADSHNTRLLRAAASLLPEDAELELLDPDVLRAIPPYDEDVRLAEGEPRAATELRRAIERSDAVLFATPEYNHSVPGVLKNALDWVSRPMAESPLMGKDVVVAGTSTGMFGAVWAQAELRKVAAALGGRVLDRELPIGGADDAWTADGALRSDELSDELADQLRALTSAARESDLQRTLARAA